jgi:hypothetical protein
MAKPKQNPADPLSKREEDIKFRSYKNDGKGFTDLQVGAEIMGVLVSVRDQEITDRRTHERKIIRVYSIRGEDDLMKLGGRALLDRVFDDIMDEHGGYSVENKRYIGSGIEWVQNRMVKFIRGDDIKSADGNRMGTYEILVEE